MVVVEAVVARYHWMVWGTEGFFSGAGVFFILLFLFRKISLSWMNLL
jgi:hypothetical protein